MGFASSVVESHCSKYSSGIQNFRDSFKICETFLSFNFYCSLVQEFIIRIGIISIIEFVRTTGHEIAIGYHS